ncbi:MAG: gluconolactonase [Lachnospiraceae bacterium]|nr:gluconolactonase [Lachnospiraceae bacterium]
MKKKKLIAALCFLLTLVMVTAFTGEIEVGAITSLPYDSYNYDYRENIHYTPAPYEPAGMVVGTELYYNGESIGALKTPQDICKSPDGNIYVADTGNNRVVVLDSTLTKVVDVITSFNNNGNEDTFSQPYGVAVSEKGNLYVADNLNKRVVVLDKDKNVILIVENPQSITLGNNFVFQPLKVTVDYADRIYVIAQGQFEGIMVFDTNGEFTNFFGTIGVNLSLWQKFWRRMATKEERANQQLYIPTEFTGIDVDPEGFIYATNIDPNGIQAVRRLNPNGQDVIRKGENENVGGDLQTAGTSDYAGVSQFVDVVYRENGIYSCLDRKRGRIFTYDNEGNLLYIFGGRGTQEGTFELPVAIETVDVGLAVLDATRGGIILFQVTEYGRLINEAVGLRFDGDEAEAVGLWERVLELDEDNELANSGIGKAYLTAGEYKTAMKYLRLAMNRDYYSIAFKRYRNELLKDNANAFLTILLVIIIGINVFKFVKKRKKGVAADE